MKNDSEKKSLTAQALHQIVSCALLATLAIGSSCSTTHKITPSVALPGPSANSEMLGPVLFLPPEGVFPLSVPEGTLLPPTLAEYMATFAERCVANTEYQDAEIVRLQKVWAEALFQEKKRSNELSGALSSEQSSMPWWVPAAAGAAAGTALGLYLGIKMGTSL